LLVYVDSREKIPWDFSDVNCEISTLTTGDYTVAGLQDKLCIERKKSVSELSSNIVLDRFYKELGRMQSYRYKYIICEFSFGDIVNFPMGSDVPKHLWRKLRVGSKFIIKKVCDIMVEYNVPFIFGNTPFGARSIAFNIMKKVYDTEHQS